MSVVLRGTGAAPGSAVGRLVVAHAGGPVGGPAVPAAPTSIAGALDTVARHMDDLAGALRTRGRAAEADIVEFAALIARDQELRGGAAEHLAAGLEPIDALAAAVHDFAGVVAAFDDELLAERAVDVRDVGRQAEALLRGEDMTGGQQRGGAPAVLAGAELAAMDLLRGARPAAAVSERGGLTGHLAIVARSLGIPLVLGIPVAALAELAEDLILVDGEAGTVEANAGARIRTIPAPRRIPGGGPGQAMTRDGRRIRVRANVATLADAIAAGDAGSEGVGLLRTELPFLNEEFDWPDEERHVETLTPILAAVPPGPVVVRTLDFTGDKRPPFLKDRHITLPGPGALTAQLRAIMRAAGDTGVQVAVLLPMVDHPRRIKYARGLLADACADLGLTPPPLGAMVELPQVLDKVDDLAEHADFLSLGTNDLTSRLLGLGRDDPRLVPASAADPVVLGAIAQTIRAGHARGRAVSLCGDAAADPAVLPHLVRLGCDAVSVVPSALARVRAAVRGC
ncbi:putative PEP-binding protein [Embleya sp. NBC_00896]|uniref:putative PEP-binding protein n=1 Tax=Embleya sp. NBC_00896 TaxID=2975961 RepID=UPI00386CBE14|nr:PEP-utilizing enzyme [Embleya sp. NBC_00896]